jgi:hypothetical protein
LTNPQISAYQQGANGQLMPANDLQTDYSMGAGNLSSSSTPYTNVPNAPLSTTGLTTPTANPYGTNQFQGSTNPYINAAEASASGNLKNAAAATAANRVNQTTPYGNLQYSQTGTDANGNPIWTANQTLSKPLEDLTNTSLVIYKKVLLIRCMALVGQTYSDAIMSRLQPTIQHQNEMSDQALANQGIVPGTEAIQTLNEYYGNNKTIY